MLILANSLFVFFSRKTDIFNFPDSGRMTGNQLQRIYIRLLGCVAPKQICFLKKSWKPKKQQTKTTGLLKRLVFKFNYCRMNLHCLSTWCKMKRYILKIFLGFVFWFYISWSSGKRTEQISWQYADYNN